METAMGKAAYRIVRRRRSGEMPRKYEATYELVDEERQEIVAVCDLIGKAVFATLEIRDGKSNSWTLKPNRKVMPSRWLVTDADGEVAVQFDQKILGKLINPLYKTVLAILDGDGNELCRLVDVHGAKASRLLGLEIGKYAVARDDKAIATFESLPGRERHEKPKGLLGKLARWLTSHDSAIVSRGPDHFLPAPFALAMYLLYDDLTDTSAG